MKILLYSDIQKEKKQISTKSVKERYINAVTNRVIIIDDLNERVKSC